MVSCGRSFGHDVLTDVYKGLNDNSSDTPEHKQLIKLARCHHVYPHPGLYYITDLCIPTITISRDALESERTPTAATFSLYTLSTAEEMEGREGGREGAGMTFMLINIV